ncbi:hypothetical protein OH76DRAFT_314238 [Lentinus brumalis]|uniref:Uncharacterized protein n=1 Tax=Lentinus brumalis TaxID=2498619 RepID=A0A371CJX8_9APHY|nr:hypothetical protein OH76DRAFT_314238 [Polyporus brumalis]
MHPTLSRRPVHRSSASACILPSTLDIDTHLHVRVQPKLRPSCELHTVRDAHCTTRGREHGHIPGAVRRIHHGDLWDEQSNPSDELRCVDSEQTKDTSERWGEDREQRLGEGKTAEGVGGRRERGSSSSICNASAAVSYTGVRRPSPPPGLRARSLRVSNSYAYGSKNECGC